MRENHAKDSLASHAIVFVIVITRMHARFGMSEMVARFIKYLEANDLVKFDVLEGTDECFENRLRIQKCAYLAKRFGLDLPFKHSIYLYGPYSESLCGEFYNIAENRADLYDGVDSQMPESFRADDFLNLVRGKSADWLEIATTLISLSDAFTKETDLLDQVVDMKQDFSTEFVSGIFDELKTANLVKAAL